MYLGDHWNHAMHNEWSRKFSESYKKKWGVLPGDYAATAYLECQLMERVIKQTGSADPEGARSRPLKKLASLTDQQGKKVWSAGNIR